MSLLLRPPEYVNHLIRHTQEDQLDYRSVYMKWERRVCAPSMQMREKGDEGGREHDRGP